MRLRLQWRGARKATFGRQTSNETSLSEGRHGRHSTSAKKASRSKFAHDEELRFKAIARRNKLLGLWAAGILGKSGAEADAYAKEVVMADFEEAGDNDVLHKVAKDLAAKGITEEQVRAQMTDCSREAVAQIKKSG